MYKLTKKIFQDVWIFFLTKKKNVIHIGKSVTANNHRNIYLNGSIINVDSILFEDNQIINYNTVETDKVFNIDTEQIINFYSNYTIETLDKNRYGLLSKVNKDWEVTTGYGSIDKQDFDFTFSSSYIVVRIVIENAFYLCFNDYEHKKVSCFLPEKKDFLWHFTLQSLKQTHLEKMEKFEKNEMKINHFVGVMNDVLWLDIDVLNIGSFLLGLDTNTGKCAYFLDTVEHQNYLPTEKTLQAYPILHLPRLMLKGISYLALPQILYIGK